VFSMDNVKVVEGMHLCLIPKYNYIVCIGAPEQLSVLG
jgi:hypothetical protein